MVCLNRIFENLNMRLVCVPWWVSSTLFITFYWKITNRRKICVLDSSGECSLCIFGHWFFKAWLNSKKIPFVQKNLYRVNLPKVYPIEDFWGSLKSKVSENFFSAKNIDQLKKKIKKCLLEKNLYLYRKPLVVLKKDLIQFKYKYTMHYNFFISKLNWISFNINI